MELKKIKCYREMSEETECFNAQLWVDGKHIADIKNQGQGGCNDFSPCKGYTYADVEKYDNLNVECKIFGMVIGFDETRKRQSKGFFLKQNGQYLLQKFPMPVSKLKRHPSYKHWLKGMMEGFKKDGYTVLNTNL